MATFTVRVVLHDADWDDYNDLYDEMQKEGFTDEIESDDGLIYKMPDAEYSMSGSFTISDVLSKAKKAASRTGRKYAVFATEALKRIWIGLERV